MSRIKDLLRPWWYRYRRFGRSLRAEMGGLAFDIVSRHYRTDGMSFQIPRDLTSREFRSRFFFDSHERDERDVIRGRLPEDATVLELGGGLGVVSCTVNSCLRDRERHVVVEANPELFGVLGENRDRNGAGFAIENCLVDDSGDGTFIIADSIAHSGTSYVNGKKIKVPTKSLAQIEARHNLQFDVLVSDIEGGEVTFFRQNPAFFARCRAVFIQFHEKRVGREACGECRAMLRDAGLTLVSCLGSNEAWLRDTALQDTTDSPLEAALRARQ